MTDNRSLKMWNLSWGNVFTSLPSDMIRHLGSPMRSWSKYLNIQGNIKMSQFPRYLGCATQSWQFSVTTQQSSQQTPASLSTSSQDLASLNSEFIRWSITLIHPFTFTVPSFFRVISMLPFLASIFSIYTFEQCCVEIFCSVHSVVCIMISLFFLQNPSI